MADRPAFSFVDLLITLAVIIFILMMLPGSKNVKKYHDIAGDYIDLKNKKVVPDVYGSHK